MLESESRQVRRARQRCEAATPRYRKTSPQGTRAERRAKRPDDADIIIRPSRLNAVASLKRARRDYRIRKGLRPARGMVHPKTISAYRFFAMRAVALIFAIAAKKADLQRATAG